MDKGHGWSRPSAIEAPPPEVVAKYLSVAAAFGWPLVCMLLFCGLHAMGERKHYFTSNFRLTSRRHLMF